MWDTLYYTSPQFLGQLYGQFCWHFFFFSFFSAKHLEEEPDSNKCKICKITFADGKMMIKHALKKHGDMIEKLSDDNTNESVTIFDKVSILGVESLVHGFSRHFKERLILYHLELLTNSLKFFI